MVIEKAMTAAAVHKAPKSQKYLKENRKWQGIASMCKSPDGRLFVTFYSGGLTECPGNFAVLATSDDDGASWIDPAFAVDHGEENIRVFDPNVWIDPLGRLWFFWAQSESFFDGRCGVWASVCANPDADILSFSQPRRIANGIMMCKPTVLSDGRWLLPCAIWAKSGEAFSKGHKELYNERFSNVYASSDSGESFELIGRADVPDRWFDEHMIVERRGGGLWMLVRAEYGIGQAFSDDGGRTWHGEGPSGISGPSTRFFIRRLQSGNLLLVYHDSPEKKRENLTARISLDDGLTWQGGLLLDRDDISYPDGDQDGDGMIYIAYDHGRTSDREIYFAKFSENDVLGGDFQSHGSKKRVLVSRAQGSREAAEGV